MLPLFRLMSSSTNQLQIPLVFLLNVYYHLPRHSSSKFSYFKFHLFMPVDLSLYFPIVSEIPNSDLCHPFFGPEKCLFWVFLHPILSFHSCTTWLVKVLPSPSPTRVQEINGYTLCKKIQKQK